MNVALPPSSTVPSAIPSTALSVLPPSALSVVSGNRTRAIARIVGVDTETNQLVDEFGRTRFFRGVNVVFKAPPWHPVVDRFDAAKSFSDEDAAILAGLGMNAIRLSVSWAGAEPEQGSFNQSYFQVIRTIIRSCAKHNIFVLIEYHQDLLAEQFCGHGVPRWLINSDWLPEWRRFPVPQKWKPFNTTASNGIPTREQCSEISWFLSYFTMAVADAFGKFYSNHDGMLDKFSAFWHRVVSEFHGEPNILGYEIINEPWPGNHWHNPLLLLPGTASRMTLYRFQERVAASIRQADPNAIIFFEGTTWDLHNRAPSVPGGIAFANRSVLSYHFYKPPAIGSVGDTMRRRRHDAKRLGCGLFLTEFEMWWPHEGDPDKALSKMWDVVQTADRFQQNWMGWSYKSFAQGPNSTDASLFDESTGKPRPEMDRLLSRPYVIASKQRVRSVMFDEQSSVFELVLDPPPQRFRSQSTQQEQDGRAFGALDAITEPNDRQHITVVDIKISIVKRIWFPEGFHVTIKPKGAHIWSFDGETQTLFIKLDPQVARQHAIRVMVASAAASTEQISSHSNQTALQYP
eukprot:jgi/Hompol1/2048/HPOL_002849-RA